MPGPPWNSFAGAVRMKSFFSSEKINSIVSLIMTLGILYIFNSSLFILPLLLITWYFSLRPFGLEDFSVFVIASVFFLIQNYGVLAKGGFEFSKKEILLMPAYEPFMWGFYFLFFKRMWPECSRGGKLSKGFIGLVVTSAIFSIFSQNSELLTVATVFSTIFLFVLFHQACDFVLAVTSLALGLVIEVFGVRTGLWSYPAPDIGGLPWWFITMWLSVGLLGRNFLFPLSEFLADKFSFRAKG